MFDIFSATGSFVHSPCGPRKSGMPESVEMPAPVSATTRRAAPIQERTSSTGLNAALRHLDLAAAAHAAAGRQAALRDHDGGRRLPAHLLQLLDRALDGFARQRAEFLRRLLERAGRDV